MRRRPSARPPSAQRSPAPRRSAAPARRASPAVEAADGAVRLQKLLSAAGVASRRAAEELIADGRVTVNGRVVTTLGAKAIPGVDEVRLDDRRIKGPGRLRYILLNKPRGYVTTRRDPEKRRTVMDLLRGVAGYVYPVGRLDYDTEGLLLLTSDGDLAARLTHPRHEVPRVYEAIVTGVPDDEAVEALRHGVFLDGRRTAESTVTRGATVRSGDTLTTKLVLTLREGRNRQVREMCARIGHPVRTLQRVRYGPLTLRGLPRGAWRDLTPAEVEALRAATR
ncbi:MAG: pseudouridine synthase [Vicinamibacterales bacterium]